MRVLDAFELVRARTTEHHAGGEGAGLTTVLEQLGVDPDDMEAAMPSVFYEHSVINMPVPAQLVAAFAAGAVYTRANHLSLPSVPLSAAAVVAAREAVQTYLQIRDKWEELRPDDIVGLVVKTMREAERGPVADPPTDDGAGASS